MTSRVLFFFALELYDVIKLRLAVNVLVSGARRAWVALFGTLLKMGEI